MDRTDYIQKIKHILDAGNYEPIKRDPTLRLERSICENLKDLERKGEIDNTLRKRITPQHSYTPQLYGLPKIHKPDIQLRPIVFSIGSAM